MKHFWQLLKNHPVVSVAQVMGLRALVLAANMATGMLSARMLGPQGRGVLAAMIVGPLTISSVFSLGLHGSVVFNTKADPRHQREFFGSALLIGATSALLGVAIGWAYVPILLEKYDASIILTTQLLMAVVPSCVISNVLVGVLEGHGEFAVVSRLGLVGCLLTLLALALLWSLKLLTPSTAASAYLLPPISMCIWLWLHARKICRPAFPTKLTYLRHMLLYAVRFFGVDLFATIGGYLDQLIMVIFLNPHDVGTYAVAISAARVLSIVPLSIATVLFPTVAGRSRDTIVEIVGVALRLSSVLTAGVALGLALLAPYVVILLYGDKFDAAVAPFRVLLAATALSNLAIIQYQVFSAAGRPAILTAFEAIGVITSTACMLVLIPYMGTLGAALSLLVSAILKLIGALAGLPLLLNLPIPRLIVSKSDIKRVLGRQSVASGSSAIGDGNFVK